MTRLWPEGEAIETWGGAEAPGGFRWRGGTHHVVEVCNRWRIHTRWWQSGGGGERDGAIWRQYVKVTTDSGLLCLLYRDLLGGGWFLARVYD